MQYRDRTDAFTNLVDRATERARQDIGLAEEGRGRAMASMIAAPFDAVGNFASGYMRGRRQGLEETQIRQQSEMDRMRLAEEQARQAFLSEQPGLREQAWKSAATRDSEEMQMRREELAMRKAEAQRATASANIANQLTLAQLSEMQRQQRLASGEAYAAGKLRKAQGEQEAYNVAKASGSPFVLAGGVQAPRPMDVMQELKAQGYSDVEAYQIASKVLPEGGAAFRTKQAIDDQTSGYADIAKKNQEYQTAIKSLEDAAKTYSMKTGAIMESGESQAALDKAIKVLESTGQQSMANQLKKGKFARAGERAFGAESTMDLGMLMNNYVAALKNEANNEIIARIEALPDYVKAQPHIQSQLAISKAGVTEGPTKPRIFGSGQQPALVNQDGITKVKIQNRMSNPFNRYATPSGER